LKIGMRHLAATLVATSALAADFSSPHPHRETRAPFRPESKVVGSLSSSELEVLDRGEVVLKQSKGKAGGVGVAVEDVEAPPSVVWSQLLSFETYPTKVPRVKVCENYEVNENRELKTRFVVHVCPGYNVEYFVRHVYAPHSNALVWTLDYDKASDLDDVHGIWRVEPHPSKRGWSRVEYSADLRLKLGVPSFIVDILTKKALKEACHWVKLESEAQYKSQKHPRDDGTLFGSAVALLDAGLRDFEASVLDAVTAIRKHSKAAFAPGPAPLLDASTRRRPLAMLRPRRPPAPPAHHQPPRERRFRFLPRRAP